MLQLSFCSVAVKIPKFSNIFYTHFSSNSNVSIFKCLLWDIYFRRYRILYLLFQCKNYLNVFLLYREKNKVTARGTPANTVM